MADRTTVQFIQGNSPYIAGDIATFDSRVAQRLILNGKAVYHNREDVLAPTTGPIMGAPKMQMLNQDGRMATMAPEQAIQGGRMGVDIGMEQKPPLKVSEFGGGTGVVEETDRDEDPDAVLINERKGASKTKPRTAEESATKIAKSNKKAAEAIEEELDEEADVLGTTHEEATLTEEERESAEEDDDEDKGGRRPKLRKGR